MPAAVVSPSTPLRLLGPSAAASKVAVACRNYARSINRATRAWGHRGREKANCQCSCGQQRNSCEASPGGKRGRADNAAMAVVRSAPMSAAVVSPSRPLRLPGPSAATSKVAVAVRRFDSDQSRSGVRGGRACRQVWAALLDLCGYQGRPHRSTARSAHRNGVSIRRVALESILGEGSQGASLARLYCNCMAGPWPW
jgi:hypothetical protein